MDQFQMIKKEQNKLTVILVVVSIVVGIIMYNIGRANHHHNDIDFAAAKACYDEFHSQVSKVSSTTTGHGSGHYGETYDQLIGIIDDINANLVHPNIVGVPSTTGSTYICPE
jgi:hypothetical protein